MSAILEARVCRLEQAAAAKAQPPIMVVTGTDDEHDAKVTEAYASRLVTEDQILVYVRRFGAAAG